MKPDDDLLSDYRNRLLECAKKLSGSRIESRDSREMQVLFANLGNINSEQTIPIIQEVLSYSSNPGFHYEIDPYAALALDKIQTDEATKALMKLPSWAGSAPILFKRKTRIFLMLAEEPFEFDNAYSLISMLRGGMTNDELNEFAGRLIKKASKTSIEKLAHVVSMLEVLGAPVLSNYRDQCIKLLSPFLKDKDFIKRGVAAERLSRLGVEKANEQRDIYYMYQSAMGTDVGQSRRAVMGLAEKGSKAIQELERISKRKDASASEYVEVEYSAMPKHVLHEHDFSASRDLALKALKALKPAKKKSSQK
jgi:hypothetical protein